MDVAAIVILTAPTFLAVPCRGSSMNKSARIATTARTGQVLCSRELWADAMSERPMPGATAISLGMFDLKGVKEQVRCKNIGDIIQSYQVIMCWCNVYCWGCDAHVCTATETDPCDAHTNLQSTHHLL